MLVYGDYLHGYCLHGLPAMGLSSLQAPLQLQLSRPLPGLQNGITPYPRTIGRIRVMAH